MTDSPRQADSRWWRRQQKTPQGIALEAAVMITVLIVLLPLHGRSYGYAAVYAALFVTPRVGYNVYRARHRA